MSARFDLALALNDMPFIVGKGEITGPSRAHFVLRTVPMPGLPESTIEIVYYDGRIYSREDASTQWYVESELDLPVDDPTSLPEADVSNAPISSIGTKTIAGTPTNQYQIWIGADDGSTDHIALDFFIGQQINYLYQNQVSIFLTDEELGQLKLETVQRLYDYDDPSIVVGPPANAIERPAMTGLAEIRNGGVLSTLAAPLGTAELRKLAAQRLGH
ncbi:MAG TPA: hypothetical protein VGD69_23520 [Herpetosiphonaceae bacterium]